MDVAYSDPELHRVKASPAILNAIILWIPLGPIIGFKVGMVILPGLISSLRTCCAGFPDKRKGGDTVYSMADIGLSAFAPFFMQSESFLKHQRALEDGHGRSNCQTLFGMARIPTDNHIRAMLDPVDPSHLQPCFDACLAALREHGGIESFQRLGGRCLIALDGTEYFRSQKLGCPHCLTRKRANGATERYHSMLAATLVAPGHTMTVPFMPEFIEPQDGHEKQDCERAAAKRWLSTHGPRLAHLKPVYLGDDLFACQPIAQAVAAQGADFLFTCKPDSHKTLYDFIAGAEAHTLEVKEKLKAKTQTVRYRWFNTVPLRDGKDAMSVNFIALAITNAKGKVTYKNAFVTSLRITKDNAAAIAACARARWKIENEGFNVLKNNGYCLEHNFGHGNDRLSMLFAAMNLLAFAFHTICDIAEARWRKAREKKGTRKRLFEHIRTITAYLVFPNWTAFLETLITSKPPPEMQNQTQP